MKALADKSKALRDFTDENNEPEDYAEKCRDGFLDAAWKAFSAKEGSYGEKAKAARDSLRQCWISTLKHIEDTLANGGLNVADPSSEDH